MKTKQSIGWIFVLTGTMFLFSGLVVMLFATLRSGWTGPTVEIPDASIWVSLANAVMEFIIELLEVEWTRVRVGVFLIVIGFLLDSGGAYMLTSGAAQTKKSARSRSVAARWSRCCRLLGFPARSVLCTHLGQDGFGIFARQPRRPMTPRRPVVGESLFVLSKSPNHLGCQGDSFLS